MSPPAECPVVEDGEGGIVVPNVSACQRKADLAGLVNGT